MTDTAADYHRHADRTGGRPLFGALLLAAGGVWLANQTHLLHLSAEALLSVLLIAIGFSLVLTGRRRRGPGLVIAGGVVTAVLLASSPNVHSFMPAGTMANAFFRPVTADQLQDHYREGFGNLTLDLSALPADADPGSIDANVGFGNLTVYLPEWMGARVDVRDGMGDVTLGGQHQGGGFGTNVSWSSPNYGTARRKVSLDLRVGHGNVEVDTVSAAPMTSQGPTAPGAPSVPTPPPVPTTVSQP